jgi:NADH-quinone oxidoreductase subunit A
VELFDYLPIAVMVVLGVGFAVVSLFISRLVAPSKPTPEKLAPYESGIVPEVEPVERFPVKFYLVAMLFVIFDIEIIFLFAWATRFSELGWVGVGTIAVFVLLAIETLIYVWKRGALDWNPPRRERYVPETEEAA